MRLLKIPPYVKHLTSNPSHNDRLLLNFSYFMTVGAFYTFGVRLSTVGKGVGSSSLFAESTHTHTHTEQ